MRLLNERVSTSHCGSLACGRRHFCRANVKYDQFAPAPHRELARPSPLRRTKDQARHVRSCRSAHVIVRLRAAISPLSGAQHPRRVKVRSRARLATHRHRRAPVSPQVATGQHIEERHGRNKAEQSPCQLRTAPDITTGCQVNPHEDHGDGVEETDQELQNLLHHLKVLGALRAACPGPCSPAPGRRPGSPGARSSPNRSRRAHRTAGEPVLASQPGSASILPCILVWPDVWHGGSVRGGTGRDGGDENEPEKMTGAPVSRSARPGAIERNGTDASGCAG